MRTFGAIRLDSPWWVINAEPHVLIKLKRVFGKMSKQRSRDLRLADTTENCRDLVWFLQRYPMEVTDRKYLEDRAEYHAHRVREMENVVSGEYVPREFDLAKGVERREYQMRAADLYLRNRFLLLADDVGLGKTAVAILSFTEPKVLPVLVVTLTHLPRQWEQEVNRFVPELHTHILKTRKPYELPEEFGRPPDVVITNYHKLSGWADFLASYTNSVVFDECQELRRSASNKYDAAMLMAHNCDYRMGLSATPIYNYGGEFFNVMNVLQHDALGNRIEFHREWCGRVVSDDKAQIEDPVAFGKYCRENFYMLRRTRQDVGRELPDVSRIPYAVDSDTSPIEKANDAAAELARIILKRVASSREDRFSAAGQFDMLMRQATGIAKAPYVADFVRLLVDSEEQVVLYGWHREVYDIWAKRLEDLGVAWYTGSETAKKKEESKDQFLCGDAKVLMMSLRAGAGVDGLQHACRTVVFGELDWSPGVHEQCIGRIHRDGQEDKVAAYYLISEEGSDPIIADVLGVKRRQVEGIRNPDQPLIEKLQTGTDNLKRLAEEFLEKHPSKARASA